MLFCKSLFWGYLWGNCFSSSVNNMMLALMFRAKISGPLLAMTCCKVKKYRWIHTYRSFLHVCLTVEALQSFIVNLDHRTKDDGPWWLCSLQLQRGYSTTFLSSGALFMVELFSFALLALFLLCYQMVYIIVVLYLLSIHIYIFIYFVPCLPRDILMWAVIRPHSFPCYIHFCKCLLLSSKLVIGP